MGSVCVVNCFTTFRKKGNGIRLSVDSNGRYLPILFTYLFKSPANIFSSMNAYKKYTPTAMAALLNNRLNNNATAE
jgi:hypothetical protein